MIDEQKRMAEWERESDLKHRKKQLLNKLTREFFTVDDLDLLTEGHPPEYFIAQNKRKVFREFNKDLVSLLVDQDKPDEEIIEEVRKMNAVTKGVYESSVPDPLKEGERRHYVNTSLEVRDILAELDRTDQAVTHVTRIQLAMDGRYVLTIRQKTAEDYARDAEIDATAGTQ